MKKLVFVILILNISLKLWAQEDLLNSLENEQPQTKQLIFASFKGTRLINLHTIETLGKGSLDFRISHRFSDFSTGASNFWGLDGPATIRLGLDYSITDRFTIGIGRSSYGKLVDGFLKYRILRQTMDNNMPISLTGLVTMNISADKDLNKIVTGVDKYKKFSSRIAYMYQLMVARKFNEKLTLQLSPTFIHYNMVISNSDKNDMAALGVLGRYKFTRSISLTGEYIFRLTKYTQNQSDIYHNSGSVGLDLETGGHVFQIFVTNSFAINEVQLIPYTTSKWDKGQIRLGFNVSRVFGLSKSAKRQKDKIKTEKKW
ncbi:MAG: hypothetical protein J7604_17985 [Sporocytophaga sp.]|uniref:DUF5777 family beta-barrel protein n=1 Tax=Sporocytophaga sp. TaxID=2231183 RepID=UPI001B0DE0F4|nr:DUF5777 family beta-barrel protein [Sporocytophaga sp.]MBO9702104.1 hypothetical protein [Sporocytophaga sp.]